MLSAGRPAFPARTREEAEGFFVGALAKWREAMGMDKMILVGHSLGGYLAASYALQHPEHVQHLVLVGPAGVVRHSYHKLNELSILFHDGWAKPLLQFNFLNIHPPEHVIPQKVWRPQCLPLSPVPERYCF